jgi:hypothetical protein
VIAITAATDNFFGKLYSYCKKGCPCTPRIASSCGGLGNLKIFFFIGLEVKKPAGSSVSNAHLPLVKLAYIIKLMKPPTNLILDGFASFFVC